MEHAQLIFHFSLAGGLFLSCATFVGGVVKRPILRKILSWPLYGIAFLLFAGAGITIFSTSVVAWLALFGALFYWCAKLVAGHINWPILQKLLSWPLFGIGYLLFASAVITVVWQFVAEVVSLFR
jgi:hypothetical protein